MPSEKQITFKIMIFRVYKTMDKDKIECVPATRGQDLGCRWLSASSVGGDNVLREMSFKAYWK